MGSVLGLPMNSGNGWPFTILVSPLVSNNIYASIRLFPVHGRSEDLLSGSQLPSTCRKHGMSATQALTLLFQGKNPDFMERSD